jgi:hypothetical protein
MGNCISARNIIESIKTISISKNQIIKFFFKHVDKEFGDDQLRYILIIFLKVQFTQGKYIFKSYFDKIMKIFWLILFSNFI